MKIVYKLSVETKISQEFNQFQKECEEKYRNCLMKEKSFWENAEKCDGNLRKTKKT